MPLVLRLTSQVVAAELEAAAAAVVDVLTLGTALFRSGDRSVIAVVLKGMTNGAIRPFYSVIMPGLRTM